EVRMELHRVDAAPLAVVRAQPWPVAVRIEGPRQQLATGQRAVAGHGVCERAAALARQRLAQRGIVAPQVARPELRRMVLYGVGRERVDHSPSFPAPAAPPRPRHPAYLPGTVAQPGGHVQPTKSPAGAGLEERACRASQATGWTPAACAPFGPWVTSYWTRCPSCRLRKPLASIAE